MRDLESRLVDASPEVKSRRAQMFPLLSDAQLKRIRKVGTERRVETGSAIYEQGDEGTPFFVLLEGCVEVSAVDGVHATPIYRQGPMEFTGEWNMVSGRRTLVRSVAVEPTLLLAVEHKALLGLVQSDSELSEMFMRAFILRRVGLLDSHAGDTVVIGSKHSAATLRVQEFLTRNGHPYRCVNADEEKDLQQMLDALHVKIEDVPILVCRGTKVLKHPSNREIAECLGFNSSVDVTAMRDVVVVGAGPAGLAAAVYAASEGLDVLVLESTAPGGQAGSSSKIENYLGFPTGISGQALAARALGQAEKFGAVIAIARTATHLDCDKTPYRVHLDTGEAIAARTIVLATGAQYCKLELPRLAQYEGVGVYYAATAVEATRCENEDVIVVGGANSAGQAATYLAGRCRHVHVVIRKDALASTMSRYLTRRIEDAANITLYTRTNIVELLGETSLERVTLEDGEGKRTTLDVRHVFSMTGAKPNTEWLKGCVELDDKGFVRAGTDVKALEKFPGRQPLLFETSLPKVFAVGDVRADSVKRVASAVGEGSICVQLLHRVLAE